MVACNSYVCCYSLEENFGNIDCCWIRLVFVVLGDQLMGWNIDSWFDAYWRPILVALVGAIIGAGLLLLLL